MATIARGKSRNREPTRESAGYVSVSELKAKLSEHLRRVERGECVVITDRGRPIATLAPIVRTNQDDDDAEIDELVRLGILRPPKAPLPENFWKLPRGKDPTGSVLRALLEERREGR